MNAATNQLFVHPMFVHPPFWLALLLSAGIATSAWSLRWLNKAGAVATGLVGLLVFWLGGGEAAVPLVAFFVSSSILSVLGKARKRQMAGHSEAGSRRDAWQVWANGGTAVALVILHRVLAFHIPLDTNRVIQVLFLASIATVNADTWATEIGGLLAKSPRLLSTWRTAPAGTSGAISIAGTLAAAFGALFIPFCTVRLWGLTTAEFVAVAWAGFLGSLFDSILGAGMQGQYRDRATGTVTENAVIDGRKGNLVHGLAWIDNNVVNLLASISGAVFCWVLLHYGLKSIY